MRSKILFVSAALVFLFGFVSLAAKWHGDAGVNVGWPASANAVKLCGSATGGFALLGFLGLLVGLILFVVAIISSLTRKIKSRGPVVPNP
jgi:hypothetical protein